MQACCGTHPSATGQVYPFLLSLSLHRPLSKKESNFYIQVQSVAIVNYERIKRTTRLYFVCGIRAVNLLYKQSQALKRLGLRLTAPPDSDSVEKAFEQHMVEVENLRKKMAEDEKKVVKDLVKSVEQRLVPQKLNGGVCTPSPTILFFFYISILYYYYSIIYILLYLFYF